MTVTDTDRQADLTVYYDGSCPLCRAEITHYRGRDTGNRLNFRDVSESDRTAAPDLTRERAMARLHVRCSDGQLKSGAAAFVEIWQRLPGWRRIAPIAGLPGVLRVLEALYRLFLPVRPIVSRFFGRIVTGRRQA